MPIICKIVLIFASCSSHGISLDMLIFKSFDSYRKHFNQLFSLSFDGKLKGLSTLRKMSQKLFDLFVHKLSKILRANADPRKRPASDIIVFRLSGHTVKLYHR